MRGVAGTLEKHHNVRILDEAIHDAVVLSNRYITGRKLPDKAVSVLDTACARVAIAQTSNPAVIEGASRRIDRLEEEIVLLKREQVTGRDHSERLEELGTQLSDAQKTKDDLIGRWKQEMELFRQITAMQKDHPRVKGSRLRAKDFRLLNN